MVYKNYVTDMLKYIVNNTAGQESRTQVAKSYSELVEIPTKEDEINNEKKSKMIINNIKNKLKGG